MNELQKKQSLCEKLNMDLNEANELFAEETLQSMQMAKIVGGNTNIAPVVISWKLLVEILGAAAAVVTIIKAACTDSKEATLAPETSISIETNADGSKVYTVTGFDGVKVIEKGDTTIVEGTPIPKSN